MKTCLQTVKCVTDECLRMYKGLGFLRLPRYPMLVDGTMIDFMVDSREARSM